MPRKFCADPRSRGTPHRGNAPPPRRECFGPGAFAKAFLASGGIVGTGPASDGADSGYPRLNEGGAMTDGHSKGGSYDWEPSE